MSRVRYALLAVLGTVIYPTVRLAIAFSLKEARPQAWSSMFLSEEAAILWWVVSISLFSIALSAAIVSWMLLRFGRKRAGSLAWVVVAVGLVFTGAASLLSTTKVETWLNILDTLINLVTAIVLPLIVLAFRGQSSTRALGAHGQLSERRGEAPSAGESGPAS